MMDTAVLETARETVTQIQAHPRLAVTAFDKRLLIEQLTKEIETLNDTILAKRAEWEQRMETLVEVAHRHADENQWCGEFDNAMAEVGLPRREDLKQDVTVYGSISCTTTIGIEVDVESQIEDRLDQYTHDDYDVQTSTEVEAEVEVKVTFDDWRYEVEGVRSGQCACESVDRWPYRGDARYQSDNFASFEDDHSVQNIEVTITHCDNCE